MCNIAPVLTRTGVFYVVKMANDLRGGGPLTANDPRGGGPRQTTSEVADHPANDPGGGGPP